ncbi:hypothetical protein H8K38_13245 [Undibacterium sp. FT79W]|uniref:hypothetical protein n=1 Tax=Undibacterium sp. FT79W TaxID=2762296 RepID=UPI00164C021E|nr:hypothetical protein [Undibacterium sp. FT79W]MBC3878773.1 hypothetical protein [Undibacterium sp. FT79W]
MDSKDIILLGLVVGAGVILARKLLPAGAKNSAANSQYVGEIVTNGEQNGWRYFDNGTAIAPNGDYYFQGTLVYKGQ